ncbi:MAG: helix-turn-helix domain-containing protein [Fulvivirga sp.]|uniref:helix-turn-helix domain-containing protein n=1 Tax=Fulvivirga sp. TaxID=1931237 RepID=UPI0032EE392A
MEFVPNNEAKKFIESIWYADHSCFLKDGAYKIIIGISDFHLKSDCLYTFSEGVYISEIDHQPFTIESGSVILLSIKPFVFKGVSIKKFLNVFNSVALSQIKESFTYAKSFETSELIQELFLNVVLDEAKLDEDFRSILNYPLLKFGNVRVGEMCRELSLSRQYVHRIVKSNLGVSAKGLIDIWKTNNLLVNGSNMSPTFAALDSGYFDQSAAIKSFKKEFDIKPSYVLNGPKKDKYAFAVERMRKRFDGYYDRVE